jgi:hypothetical protein
MYVCGDICMYMGCISECGDVYMCVGVYVCLWGVCTYVCVWGVPMYLCVWGCMYVCGDVCMCVGMYACVCVSVFVGTRVRKETGSAKGNQ